MYCEICFHFIVNISVGTFKAVQKPFWWSIRVNYFMCVLLKTQVENCNADVPEVKLQKRNKKKTSILDRHLISLPASPRLLFFLTRGSSLSLQWVCVSCAGGSTIKVAEGLFVFYLLLLSCQWPVWESKQVPNDDVNNS